MSEEQLITSLVLSLICVAGLVVGVMIVVSDYTKQKQANKDHDAFDRHYHLGKYKDGK